MKRQMKSLFLVCILILAVQAFSKQSNETLPQSDDHLELVQLVELSRHGARAPFYAIWDYYTNWNVPLVTLTSVGMRQHYLIGQELRNRYGNTIFNGSQYNSSAVRVLSTSSNRAQQSALSQLYGIFQKSGENMPRNWVFQPSTDLPPMHVKNGQQILKDLKRANLPNSYEPINVQLGNDPRILESSDYCSGFDTLKAANFNTKLYQEFDASLSDFKKEFISLFGLNIDPSQATVKLISEYWDSVVCDIYEQIDLPANFTQEFVSQMEFIYDFQQLYIDFNSDSGDLLKLQTTAFFSDLISVMKDYSTVKFNFYSASDGNLNSVLLALGYQSFTTNYEEWTANQKIHSNTPFASTIFFEVYRNKISEELFLKMIYNNSEIKIIGCESIVCSLSEFEVAIGQIATLDSEVYNQLCPDQESQFGRKKGKKDNKQNKQGNLVNDDVISPLRKSQSKGRNIEYLSL